MDGLRSDPTLSLRAGAEITNESTLSMTHPPAVVDRAPGEVPRA